MVSTQPAFESRCQLHLSEGSAMLRCGALANCSRYLGARVGSPKVAGLAQWQCRELVPLRRVFDSLDQLQLLEGNATCYCVALANCSRYLGARVGSLVYM